MKTDPLFHQYFQIAPQALFELLQIRPGCAYRFESPVIKASERRLDGLFAPVEPGYPHYFLEVQGYLDKGIYWRAIHEVGGFYYQRPKLFGQDWRIVLLFLDKAFDPGPETLGPLALASHPWLIRGLFLNYYQNWPHLPQF